ncbi:TetR/AcrR family transcriptional regulator [Pelagibacterium flavum]|uniref:TetR/AcrR family transcriptional regulator n=1 Tax=Pelagibacterium flavum TaxID=2984530 RepID=A0ABY6IU80_9HYPH|nr:TetR/AcrR family transcriptional regulator [Pelagibacterium sp. YIM 151497]UYQ72862.1 TetR/AcrR family transcriptional regulator [Pelagibacterium sp. YIM 151497]
MPRHFTAADNELIRSQLLAAGLAHFTQYGLRGMRVDDVCRDVGVAKGTFYKFFEHKEALFLAIADQRDQMHKAETLAFFAQCDGPVTDRAGRFFDLLVEKLRSDPLVAIASVPDDFAALLRKMPPERMAHEEEKDLLFIQEFCDGLRSKGLIGPVDPHDIAAILTLLVSLVLQQNLFSASQFSASCALLREMFVQKLTATAP